MAIAIFSGIVLFSIIFLYTKTADRWNWKKIVIWAGVIAMALVVIFLLVAYSDGLFKDSPKNHKGRLTSYGGFSIGSNFSDVEFTYGRLKKLPEIKGDAYDVYEHPAGFGYFVNKADKKIIGVLIDCSSSIKDEFNGIACGDPSEKLQKKFGDSLKIKCEPSDKKPWEAYRNGGWETVGDVSRLYAVDKFGTRYILTRNTVSLITMIPSPSKSEFWVDCD